MERGTIFRIASMSKPITVAVALILMEQGALRLDDPITKWAPEFAHMRVLRRPDGSLQDTYPAPRSITIEDLMTHRSGLSYGFTARGALAQALQEKFGLELDSAYTPDEWMKTLASLPLAFAPGERFNYGYSTDVLGYIIGRAAGRTFRQAAQELLFAPLHMIDTDFWIPVEKRGRAAVLYRSAAPGNFTPASLPGFMDEAPPSHTAGGYGLVSGPPMTTWRSRAHAAAGRPNQRHPGPVAGIDPLDDHKSADAGAATRLAVRHSLLYGARFRTGRIRHHRSEKTRLDGHGKPWGVRLAGSIRRLVASRSGAANGDAVAAANSAAPSTTGQCQGEFRSDRSSDPMGILPSGSGVDDDQDGAAIGKGAAVSRKRRHSGLPETIIRSAGALTWASNPRASRQWNR